MARPSGKVIGYKMRALILSETFLVLRRIQRDIIVNAFRSPCRVAYSLSLVKVKVKFALEEAMKAQRGSRGMTLLFL
jgi:hypothetical protein